MTKRAAKHTPQPGEIWGEVRAVPVRYVKISEVGPGYVAVYKVERAPDGKWRCAYNDLTGRYAPVRRVKSERFDGRPCNYQFVQAADATA